MRAVFISDAHLDGNASDGYRYLMRLLDSMRGSVDELFIVGDFFDFWFAGEGGVYPGFRDIVQRVLEVQREGTSISLFEGNHDFFLSDYFAQYGIRVFPDGAGIDLDGKKVFVSHGDTVDTSKRGYLSLRRILRSDLFYKAQKKIPSPVLWQISRTISKMSRACEMRSSNGLAARMSVFAMEKFEEGFDTVVLGHCHSPLLEQRVIHDRVKTFAILGDWISDYSYLLYDNGEFATRSGLSSD